MAPKVFISHESALLFWRKHDLDQSGGIERVRTTTLRDATSALRDIRPLLRSAGRTTGRIYGSRPDESLESTLVDLGIDELPLHVMIKDRSKRRNTSSVVTHVYEASLPEGSFCQVDENVFVSSPELTLVQLSTKLSFVDLLEIALEFCGGYALNPQDGYSFDYRPALTDVPKLTAYALDIRGRHGARTFAPILSYIVEDSASPMETIVLMLLCLPSKLGGQQLPLPKHNVKIPITERARSHTKRKHLICDLFWEKYRLDVECDSTLYHASKEQLGIDSDRRIILDAMGYSYVGITWWQLEHEEEFLNVVQAIRKAMGLKLQSYSPEHVLENRNALRMYLTTPHGKRTALRLRKK